MAFREPTDGGVELVFPAQLTRERPDLPEPRGRSVTLAFEGPVPYVYAGLVVRLAHGGVFGRPELWRNAAEFPASAGGRCGVWLRAFDDGRAELVVFHSPDTALATRHIFEEYVHTHLLRKAAPASVSVRRLVRCAECHTPVSEEVVEKRRALGRDHIVCPVCDCRVPLDPAAAPVDAASAVRRIDERAQARVTADASIQVLKAKRAAGQFDVFLCHNSADKPAVRALADRLEAVGILPWLDERELQPGVRWQRALSEQIQNIATAAVLIGASGMGPWHMEELEAFLSEFHRRKCPLIPVLLPTAPKEPQLPIFLRGTMWVDLRLAGPDPLDQLLWGITGRRDSRR